MKTNLYWDGEGRTFAKRNIKAGEELLVGYGFRYWNGIKHNNTLKKKSSKKSTTRKNKKE
jgi:SET domain-containing protein